ncbi:putative methyltransferase PMT11 [Canna indica]|uniref:Methyltransferase PMT11 n=1 Tax=Canna indica TaxID=4628 RepID=A0AAQ3K9J3_9LILI|nr:putative methyltransferase PMT11 [Canna indica]
MCPESMREWIPCPPATLSSENDAIKQLKSTERFERHCPPAGKGLDYLGASVASAPFVDPVRPKTLRRRLYPVLLAPEADNGRGRSWTVESG